MPKPRNTAPRVRSAGMPNDIDDDTLRDTTSPDVLSTLRPDQLARRRVLRRQQSASARRKRMSKVPKRAKNRSVYCVGHTTSGNPCESRHVIGSDYCAWHMAAAERELLGVRYPGELSGRARSSVVKAPEMLRQVMETNVDLILRPYFEALGIKLIGYDEETCTPLVEEVVGGGLKLYGESKDGDIVMTPYPDLGGMVTVAEKLMDRVYGKPKQSTTIEGGINPIKVQPIKSQERAIEVATILAQARVLPAAPSAMSTAHEGRRRPQSAEVIDINRDGGEIDNGETR